MKFLVEGTKRAKTSGDIGVHQAHTVGGSNKKTQADTTTYSSYELYVSLCPNSVSSSYLMFGQFLGKTSAMNIVTFFLDISFAALIGIL